MMRLALVLAIAGLAGCGGGDADGDGLTNKEEKDLQLDPNNDDTDGDGVSDGDEIELGTDPVNADSDQDGLTDGEEINTHGSDPMAGDGDGDGYGDYWEVFEGSDPADPASKIYEGGWPYNPSKDSLAAGDTSDRAEVGEPFGRFKLLDHFGDTVDLYDFANEENIPIVFDVSAGWCGPCRDISAWLDGDNSSYDSFWPGVREAVEDGEVYWVTVMGENTSGRQPEIEDLEEWYEDFPHPGIPVLADDDYLAVEHINLGFWPTLVLLESDMIVTMNASELGSYSAILDEVSGRL